jgi:hypothetical protein
MDNISGVVLKEDGTSKNPFSEKDGWLPKI